MIRLISLLKESIEDKKLNFIANETMKKYPNINNGGCAQFALILSDLFGFKKFYLFYEEGPHFPSHVAINLNGKIYDPEGIYSLTKYKKHIKSADLKDVRKYRRDLGDRYNHKKLEQFIKNLL
jgi:hypothetical protein